MITEEKFLELGKMLAERSPKTAPFLERIVKDRIRSLAENYIYPSIKTTLKGFLMNTTLLTKNGTYTG